jgi:hypothetical protein
MIVETGPTLSAWMKWTDRKRIPDGGVGVYVLAHLSRVPEGPADATHRDVVYIGESNALHRRWNNFHLSANTGNSAHCAGRTYYDFFKRVDSSLHVAWCATPETNPQLRIALIKFWERKLLLAFAARRHAEGAKDSLLPKCNRH